MGDFCPFLYKLQRVHGTLPLWSLFVFFGTYKIDQHLYSPVVLCYHNAMGSYHKKKKINNNTTQSCF